jgi:adenylate cyclase
VIGAVATSRSGGAPRRRLIALCGLVPAALAGVLAIYRPAPIVRLDNAVYDSLLRSAHREAPSSRVVIIDIDEHSLTTVGQWPWRRDVVAQLVNTLRDMGATTIALDIMFPEPDRLQLEKTAAGGPRTPDEAFAATLRGGRVILGYGLTFETPGRSRAPCVLHPISLPIIQTGDDVNEPHFFGASGAVCSLPMLSEAAKQSGFLNAAPDSDGILRRVPLIAELNGRMYPSLALAAVAATIGGNEIALRITNVNAGILSVDSLSVPVDGKSNLLLRYRGEKQTFPYISAADVLAGRTPVSAIEDRIAFVGTTALGQREVVATPLDTLFAGVEVQATVADNLLQQDFIQRSAHATPLEVLALVTLTIAITLVVVGPGIVAGLLASVAGIALSWWGAGYLLSNGVFLSPLSPILAIAGAMAGMTLAKFGVERRRADREGREKTTAQSLMVQSLLSLTEVRDLETGKHSQRTQKYARVLATELAANPEYREFLTRERIDLLSSLAPLHDIGKVGIPDHILNKPGALTAEEYAEMRKHPTLGREVIIKAEQRVGVRDDATLEMAKNIVYTHHERWDGSGYPQGLRSTQIPVAGRVMAVVDVYDACVTRSLYRPPLSHKDTVQMIARGRGTHFDPAVVDAFLNVASVFQTVSSHEFDY